MSVVNFKEAMLNGKSSLVNLQSFTGDLEFIEGFQFGLTTIGQQLLLSANKDSGEPLSCESFFPNRNDCGSIISSINGAETINNPGIIQLHAGRNIAIYDDPANHRIYIGLKFEKGNVCTPILV